MATVTAELSLEITRLKAGLDQARAEIRGFKAAAKKEGDGIGSALFGNLKSSLAGFASVGGLTAAAVGVKEILSQYDDIADTALKLNESTEVVQRVGAAAELSGSSVGGLAGATLKLEKALGEAGNEKAAAALEHYGVTAAQLASLPLDQKILVLAEAFQKARAEGTGYNDLLALMGKGAGELIPLLAQSREEIEALFAGAAVVDDSAVQRLAQMNDEFDKMVQHAKAFAAIEINSVMKGWGFLKDVMANHVAGVQKALATGDMSDVNPMKNIEDANTAAGEKDYEEALAAKARASKREQNRKSQSQGLGAQAAEAGRKSADKSGDELEKLRRDSLPDEARLAALQAAAKDIYSQAGVSSEAGLQDKAYAQKQYGGSAAELEKTVGLLKQVRDLNKEISSIEEKKKTQAEQLQKQTEDLRESTEKAALKQLSKPEQADAIRQQLAESFGFEIKSSDDVGKGLSQLKSEADKARAAGDTEGEKKALEKLKAAQEQAGQLAGLAPAAKSASVAGETAGVLNVLFGRSGSSDLVLDENKQQTSALRDIQRVLERIERINEAGGAQDDFGFGN